MIEVNEIPQRLIDGGRSLAKGVAFRILGSAPRLRSRLDALRASGVSTILNLHRVAVDDGSDYRPLDPQLFDELLSFVKREFAVVTIGELGEASRKPKLVLSFDDGYRDFLINAVPLLKRHGLPSNQNIIPQCVLTGRPPLNVIAQDFVGKAPDALVRKLRVPGFTIPAHGHFGNRLSSYLKLRSQAEQDAMAEVLLPQFFGWHEFRATPMMTSDEIRSLNNCEIGAHSWAHASMEHETDAYLLDDVRRCDAYFAQELKMPMTIYAFPNGSCGPGQADLVMSAGVTHVLLVGDAFDRENRVHRRFTFDGRTRSEIRFKALGGRAAL